MTVQDTTQHQALVACLQSGRFVQAESIALDLTRQTPDDPFGWKVHGSLLVQRECYSEAIAPLERALVLSPEDAETLNNLGLAHYKLDQLDDALECYRLALASKPDFVECLNNQGMVQQALGHLHSALDSYERALKRRPNYIKAHNNCGSVLRELGHYQEALASHDRVLALDPENAEAHSLRGLALQHLGQFNEALACQSRALAIQKNDSGIWVNLGLILRAKGALTKALTVFDKALTLNPRSVEALNNGGLILQALGRNADALTYFKRALALKPHCIEALNNLAVLHHGLGQIDVALEMLNTVLGIAPNDVPARINRGSVLRDIGQLDMALADLEQAQSLDPTSVMACSNALFLLNYHPDKSAEELFDAYREFERRFGLPHHAHWRVHTNDHDAERRLRIGYVSPDFRSHSMRHFLEPLLAQHDRSSFEVMAYAELTQEDALTAVYRGLVDRWVPTHGLSDDDLSERIRADGVDILVDLAGHTANNRLSVFARCPAPVSVSWMGYGYTTGLTAIDYFLTDAVMAPPETEALFAERLWRIEPPSMVYRPAADMGEVGSLPALRHGHITFGTLTRSVRINHHVIRVWSQLLRQLPEAHLVVDSKDFATETMQQRFAERFAAHGIDRERLEIGYHSPPWDVLRRIDISLDCFPHNSGTTLIESLYMGVPFITLAARPSVGRIGSMILAGAGHPQWIAATEAEYVDKAAALASDLERLADIRANLRTELEAGPWRDEAGFARRVEHAYRQMWRRWCETAPVS